MIKFTVPGKPQPKQRPRVLKTGITFTPKETVKYEELVRECCPTDIRYEKDDELELKVIAYFSIPKSWSKSKKEKAEAGQIKPTTKPDIDNILKIISDALNRFAYEDDSSIVRVVAEKHYSPNPRVEVELNKIYKEGKGNE